MSFYLRKGQSLVCCKHQGKVTSRSYRSKTPEDALKDLCEAAGLQPSPERRYDILFEMSKERGCAFPSCDMSEEQLTEWRKRGMPGNKYECDACESLLPTPASLSHHMHDKHSREVPASDCMGKLSRRCQPGLLYFDDLHEVTCFLSTCKPRG